jgi:hypothetical protein
MAEVSSGALSLLAFIVSALIVAVAALAWSVWRHGWHLGGPPRE